MTGSRDTILIAGRTEVDRALLADLLREEYSVVEAADGAAALACVESREERPDLILLGSVMFHMDGLEFLSRLRAAGLLPGIPVVLIVSGEAASYLNQAYELGVTECIARPFHGTVIRRRLRNVLLLARRRAELEDMVAGQIRENDRNTTLMMDILGSVVESRSHRSGLHVLRIRRITRILLELLSFNHPEYGLTPERIALIANASALHDIGKVLLPLDTLHKPGPLTGEEYDVLKTHTILGAELLEHLEPWQKEPLVMTARVICRWHHERYDGGGYPDGLKGEEIPLEAQVVALADVYGTLTGPRLLLRPAFTHEYAMEMIRSGSCGMFHPALVDCLNQGGGRLAAEAAPEAICRAYPFQEHGAPPGLLPERGPSLSERTVLLLEQERSKYRFFASLSHEILFEYDVDTDTMAFSGSGTGELGVPPIATGFAASPEQCPCLTEDDRRDLTARVGAATPDVPVVSQDCLLTLPDGSRQWHKITLRTLWTPDQPPRLAGCIGNLANIHSDMVEREHLRFLAQRDCLTDLFNRKTARDYVDTVLDGGLAAALLILDVDNFKRINDSYGHAFGDRVLKLVAERVQQNIRRDDMAARIGGDEFLIFLRDVGHSSASRLRIRRLYDAIAVPLPGVPCYSVSMGGALCPQDGNSYDDLFRRADQALYGAKGEGKSRLAFYQPDRHSAAGPSASAGVGP